MLKRESFVIRNLFLFFRFALLIVVYKNLLRSSTSTATTIIIFYQNGLDYKILPNANQFYYFFSRI